MEDMMQKMGEILSDPESLRQLQELAQMLQQESSAPEAPESGAGPDDSHPDDEAGGFDFGMLLKIQELMGSLQHADADTRLLLALRPHLTAPRQKKVDQAVKLLKLYAAFSAVQENGLLNDLL